MSNERWALVVDSRAHEITNEDPSGRYHESLVWLPVGPDVEEGWLYLNGKWTPPLPPPAPELGLADLGSSEPLPPPPQSYRTVMTPIRFKAQFSVGEQVAIKRTRAYAGEDEGKAFARDALDILFGSLDDPRLAEVDVADTSVIGGIDFCQSIGILTAERAATIKLGLPATA